MIVSGVVSIPSSAGSSTVFTVTGTRTLAYAKAFESYLQQSLSNNTLNIVQGDTVTATGEVSFAPPVDGKVNEAVLIGGGAALDFVVGLQRRAPLWVQRSGFEWAWRLTHDFRRLAHRYLVQDAAIVALMARELVRPSKRADMSA